MSYHDYSWKTKEVIVQIATNKSLNKEVPREDSIILHFNKIDSQIARNWSKSKTKDMFDDES